jgi:peptidoglycan/LPS O-acetylase OafA/YrhL
MPDIQLSTERIDYIDSLRGIAILLVVATHVGSFIGLTGRVGRLVDSFASGVQLFFVLSAFTIYLTYARSVDRGVKHPLKGFLIRRLTRIVPVYWMGILFYSLVYGLSSRWVLPGPSVWHYPLHLLLVNIWVPDAQSSVVPGGWSISLEVMFYLAFPFIIRLVQDFRSACTFLLITLIPLPLISDLLRYIASNVGITPHTVLVDLFWERCPLNQFACFAYGFVAYFIVKEKRCRLLQDKRLNVLLVVTSGMIYLFAVKFKVPHIPRAHIFAMAFCALTVALSYWKWVLFANAAFSFLGRVSYSIYLLHFLVIKQLSHIFHPSESLFCFCSMFSATLFVSSAVAYLFFRAVELPAIQLGKKWVMQIERAPL